jgi:hypothetical protein
MSGAENSGVEGMAMRRQGGGRAQDENTRRYLQRSEAKGCRIKIFKLSTLLINRLDSMTIHRRYM